MQLYIKYEFGWFCRNTSYLNFVIFKINDRSEHLPKYLFIKDLISWWWENKKKMVNLENLEIVCLINLD